MEVIPSAFASSESSPRVASPLWPSDLPSVREPEKRLIGKDRA